MLEFFLFNEKTSIINLVSLLILLLDLLMLGCLLFLLCSWRNKQWFIHIIRIYISFWPYYYIFDRMYYLISIIFRKISKFIRSYIVRILFLLLNVNGRIFTVYVHIFYDFSFRNINPKVRIFTFAFNFMMVLIGCIYT